MITEHITIGKIGSAHGVRGELKVVPLTDDVRRFSKLKKCFLTKEDGTIVNELAVKTARIDRGNVLIVFEGIQDRDAAEKLRGLFIAVAREDAVKLSKGEFFIVDLIGLRVVDDERGDLGTINDVYETGSNFVISVKRKRKPDLQIPFLKVVCYDTSIEDGVMKVRLPDGLYEIYEPNDKKSKNHKKTNKEGK